MAANLVTAITAERPKGGLPRRAIVLLAMTVDGLVLMSAFVAGQALYVIANGVKQSKALNPVTAITAVQPKGGLPRRAQALLATTHKGEERSLWRRADRGSLVSHLSHSLVLHDRPQHKAIPSFRGTSVVNLKFASLFRHPR